MRTRRYWGLAGDYGKAPGNPVLEVEDNPEVGRLLRPNGTVLKIVRAKATVPFGPQPTKKERDEED